MGNDAVGYARPPHKSRFKKGKSGNPAGRPKGTRNLASELKRELANLVTVRENGESRRVSKRVAILKSLVAKALAGDVKAIRAVVELLAQFEHFEGPVATASVSSDEQRILRRFLPRALKEASRKRKGKSR
jgi:hypothetical protein